MKYVPYYRVSTVGQGKRVDRPGVQRLDPSTSMKGSGRADEAPMNGGKLYYIDKQPRKGMFYDHARNSIFLGMIQGLIRTRNDP